MVLKGKLLCFGPFEVDVQSGELRQNGEIVRIAEKPQKALLVLLERAGDVVSREELRQRLWPDGTYVEFDDNLNATIKRLREVLDDSAVRPRYIETVPRRGYRFVGRVVHQAPEVAASTAAAVRQPTGCGGRRWPLAAAILFAVLSSLSGGRPTAPTLLAVMPITNLTGSPGQQYLAEGLTEDLIAKIGRVSPARLAVIARTSAFRAASPGQLGADYVLTGELRQGSVVTHLRRARSGHEMWTGEYPIPLQETFLGVLIARQVAARLNIQPPIWNRAELSHAETSDRAAYEAYLRGVYAFHHELPGALDFFGESLRRDPQFALPLAGQARAAGSMAQPALQAGIAIDPAIADFFVLRGNLLARAGSAHDAIEGDYQRALQLNPNHTEALEQYALYLRERRPKEALEYIQRARHLDPLSPEVAATEGWVLISARKLDEADACLHAALRLDPQYPATLSYLGNLDIHRGRNEPAIVWFEKAANASGRDPEYLYRLARAYARAGRRENVGRVLTELREQARSRTVKPQMIESLEGMVGGS